MSRCGVPFTGEFPDLDQRWESPETILPLYSVSAGHFVLFLEFFLCCTNLAPEIWNPGILKSLKSVVECESTGYHNEPQI